MARKSKSLLENSCDSSSGGLAGEAACHHDDHGPVDIGLVVGREPFVLSRGPGYPELTVVRPS